ncbi:hypothetical protein [Kitasatospora sp. NPDC093806]|uniref:hypothetical protein n=1 Tax=Kitasatospora sp. NPDC093806 TaxID=3155075 RepID=UPI00343F9E2D
MFAKVVPALVAAGFLLGSPATAEAVPAAAHTVTTAAQASPARAASAATVHARSADSRTAQGSVLMAGDKKDDKKKGGFFKKLGLAVIVVILLIVLFAIGLVVAIVFAVRAIFRRRRTA